MAIIKRVSGFLQHVDTDEKTLRLAIQLNPPEPDTEEQSFRYQFNQTPSDEQFLALVGSQVVCTDFEGVIRRLSTGIVYFE